MANKEFRSTPLREGRRASAITSPFGPKFRSTPLREGRPSSSAIASRSYRFDPRPCERGGGLVNDGEVRLSPFRSTPLREGRPSRPPMQRRWWSFDPRPCERGDRSAIWILCRQDCFDPRPCERGDQALASMSADLKRFDPRPCERGDFHPDEGARLVFVSIHAPARGATCGVCGTPARGNVSIHAPARGATTCRLDAAAYGQVSIHAPARGATPRVPCPDRHKGRFDPRPCERGDPADGPILAVANGFDPRPCERGDRQDRLGIVAGKVSIHAPARGATLRCRGGGDTREFRSTPLREGRPGINCRAQLTVMFRSTPLREGRLCCAKT